jgi:hypothetical protein
MKEVASALSKLDFWIEREGFSGWDPHDALNSRALKALTFGNRRLGQVFLHVLKRCPINVRPLLGIKKGCNPKGMGLFLASYWRKYQMSKQARHLERVNFFADWLHANVVPGYHGAC